MDKRVTIEDIAKKLNKSKGLVSLALSNKYGVSEETRSQIILEAMRMGYEFRPQKSVVSSKSNRRVNVMLAYTGSMLTDEFYWAQVVSGLERVLRQNKAIISLMNWDDMEPSEALVSLYRSECDGVIIVGSVAPTMFENLKRLGRPIILVDSSYISYDFTQVKASNYTSAYLVAKYLYELGHRHLCFFGDTRDEETLARRKEGVKRFAEQFAYAGVRLDVLDDRLDKNSFEYCSMTQLRKYVQQDDIATAMICANDAIAVRAYEALAEAGLRIPEDISVVGFDDTNRCEQLSPKLTSVFVNVQRMGEVAVEQILREIHRERGETDHIQIEIEAPIVERESVKSLK